MLSTNSIFNEMSKRLLGYIWSNTTILDSLSSIINYKCRIILDSAKTLLHVFPKLKDDILLKYVVRCLGLSKYVNNSMQTRRYITKIQN